MPRWQLWLPRWRGQAALTPLLFTRPPSTLPMDAPEDEEESQPQGYALQIIDEDANNYLAQGSSGNNHGSSSSFSSKQDLSKKECLTRRRKDNQLVLASCSQERAWYWQINDKGILYFEKRKSSSSRHKKSLLKKNALLK